MKGKKLNFSDSKCWKRRGGRTELFVVEHLWGHYVSAIGRGWIRQEYNGTPSSVSPNGSCNKLWTWEMVQGLKSKSCFDPIPVGVYFISSCSLTQKELIGKFDVLVRGFLYGWRIWTLGLQLLYSLWLKEKHLEVIGKSFMQTRIGRCYSLLGSSYLKTSEHLWRINSRWDGSYKYQWVKEFMQVPSRGQNCFTVGWTWFVRYISRELGEIYDCYIADIEEYLAFSLVFIPPIEVHSDL